MVGRGVFVSAGYGRLYRSVGHRGTERCGSGQSFPPVGGEGDALVRGGSQG